MSLAVIMMNVGAGDMGVLTDGMESALLDFGARGTQTALRALARLTNRRPWPRPFCWAAARPPYDSFVLSHPHADHYNGLLAFAAQAPAAREPPSLVAAGGRFYHPRVPSNPEAREFVLRLSAINEVLSGIPEHALSSAVRASAAGPVTRGAVAHGDVIPLAGHDFDVLWPPRELSAEDARRLGRLVERYDALAERLTEEDDPRLQDAVERLRQTGAEDIDEMLFGGARPNDDETPPDVGKSDYATPETIFADGDALPWGDELNGLYKAVTQGANLLSLVLASRADHSYVFLGDLDRAVHGRVAPELLGEPPQILSSAHHGTHLGRELESLRARYVLTSVGPPLSENVCDEYSAIGMHIRTDRAGDIAAVTYKLRTRLWTVPQ